MHAKVAMPVQRIENCGRDGAQPDLKSRAIGDQIGNKPGDGPKGIGHRSERRILQRPRGSDHDVDILRRNLDQRRSWWDSIVQLGDNEARGLDQRPEIFAGKTKAVGPGPPPRCKLQEQNVHALRQVGFELRVVDRKGVHDARIMQQPRPPGATICGKPDDVRVGRVCRCIPANPGKDRYATKIVTLRHQRFGQGQRFGRGLAPADGLAGADQAAEIQIARLDLARHQARSKIAAMP